MSVVIVETPTFSMYRSGGPDACDCGTGDPLPPTVVILPANESPTIAAYNAFARFRDDSRDLPHAEPVRPLLGVGRNDPCPCKSGKKFKACCLKKAPAKCA